MGALRLNESLAHQLGASIDMQRLCVIRFPVHAALAIEDLVGGDEHHSGSVFAAPGRDRACCFGIHPLGAAGVGFAGADIGHRPGMDDAARLHAREQVIQGFEVGQVKVMNVDMVTRCTIFVGSECSRDRAAGLNQTRDDVCAEKAACACHEDTFHGRSSYEAIMGFWQLDVAVLSNAHVDAIL